MPEIRLAPILIDRASTAVLNTNEITTNNVIPNINPVIATDKNIEIIKKLKISKGCTPFTVLVNFTRLISLF